MKNKNRNRKILLLIFRLIPLLIIIGITVYMVITNQEISVDRIMNYTPNSVPLAILFILIMYAFKSLSFVFPIVVLMATSGYLFNIYLALIVNIVGTVIALSIPYYIGRFSGADYVNDIMKKYKKLEFLDTIQKDNNFFFSFISRVIGILPTDAVSLYMGSVKIDYVQYLLGGILGFLPRIIATTIMGSSITDITSPAFIVSFSFNMVLAITCILIYRKKLIKKGHKEQ